MKKQFKIVPWVTVFDDAADKAAADAAAAAAAAAGNKDKGEDKNATFTQEQLNKILADDRRKNQDRTRKVLEELEALKTKSTLSEEERNDLNSRIETMSNELLTKEELAKKEQQKITQKYTEDLKKAEAERAAWQQRYTNSTIQRTITDAAATNEAFSPRQVIAILEPATKLVEALDKDGQPTGELVPTVKFSDTDKDGKPVTLNLTVAEAVKRMSEMDEYANLFKSKGVGGAGGSNRGGGGKPLDARKIAATDPAEYRRLRREGKI